MIQISSLELFDELYPDSALPGMFALYTTTLEKNNDHTYWCFQTSQADRRCGRFSHTRRVRFGAALHSEALALQIAKERNSHATAGNILGCAASVTAVPAFWAVIPYSCDSHSGSQTGLSAPLPSQYSDALGLLKGVGLRPSIVISTREVATREGAGQNQSVVGGKVYAFWLLDRLWLFDPERPGGAERAEAGALLARVQGAVARLATERGFSLGDGEGLTGAGITGDLAASFPLPGFPTGATAKGPRAVLEVFPTLPGEARYRRRDFESLPEPPPLNPQPWHAVLTPSAGVGNRRIFPFAPIAEGCSWIRDCRARRASLTKKQLKNAVRLLISCKAPAADARDLVHELYGGHTGYDEVTVDRMLSRELCAPGGPTTCTEAGEQPGVVERHCSKCPHFGNIESPVELAQLAAYVEPDAARAVATDRAPELATSRTDASPARTRIVITSDRRRVNDQAFAVLAAQFELFARNGQLFEVLRISDAAPVERRITEARLDELLSRTCDFVVLSGPGADPRSVPPPRRTKRGILARGHWPELQRNKPTPPIATPSTPKPKEEPRMMIDDLWTADGPSFADLEVLESLARYRRGFERIKPQNDHQEAVRNRLLSLLDEMEDLLCEEGHEAPELAESWERVDELEALYWQAGQSPAEESQPSNERPEPHAAASPSALARIDDCRPPAASCESSRDGQPDSYRKAA